MEDFEAKLLTWIRKECRKQKVKFRIRPYKSIKCDAHAVAGYFDEDIPSINVASKHPGWIFVLSHEFCHMLQWKQQTPIWKTFCKCGVNTDHWLEGKYARPKQLRSAIFKTIAMELECEKMSLHLLQSFGYTGGAEYTRKATAYTLFYLYMLEHRKWYKRGHSPYGLEQVWSQFPDSFDIDYEETYERLKHLYAACV